MAQVTQSKSVRYRLAFIDYFPTHYRRRLYEEIDRRSAADFYFFSDERERWWNPNIPHSVDATYHRVDLTRYRIAGQAVMPGIVPRILAGRYDAVIKGTNGKLMLPLTYGAAKARGTAFVLWQGMWMHPKTRVHRATKSWLERVYRGSGAIVTYGEHTRQFILQAPGVAPDKVFVAGQAIDPTPFEAIDPIRDTDTAEILYIGQFEHVKGLPYLIDAFDQLSGTPARLRMVGGGSLEGWLRSRVEGDDRVELVGYRGQEELPADLARARCLVLPSVTTELDKETWGMVINEAFHAGLPVVTTDAVGAAAAGLVRDGRSGFIVPERDSAALATALRRLVEDPALAARMGDAGREDVAVFNYTRMADAFLAAVDYAVANASRGRRQRLWPAR